MVDFSKLKSLSGKKSLEILSEELNKMSSKGESKGDDRFWRPTVDKAGNGYAVIRFLPAAGDESIPWTKFWEHAFQGPSGLWYIEKSRNSLGSNMPDPVSEYNSKLWNSTKDDDAPERKQARKQKRNLRFVSNIYVVSDPGNPDNEGKVFLFKYGKKIFDKLNEIMNPESEYEEIEAWDPFDLWQGANFKLRVRKVEGYPNFDKSEFDKRGPLFKDDEKLEEVWKKEYLLAEFLDPASFKSYDDLKARLHKVLGLDEDGNESVSSKKSSVMDEDDVQEQPKLKKKVAPKMPVMDDGDDDDESLEFFKKLAAD